MSQTTIPAEAVKQGKTMTRKYCPAFHMFYGTL